MMHEDICPGYRDIAQREDIEDAMEKIRSDILSDLSRLEKAALFEDYDEFWYLYAQDEKEKNWGNNENI